MLLPSDLLSTTHNLVAAHTLLPCGKRKTQEGTFHELEIFRMSRASDHHASDVTFIEGSKAKLSMLYWEVLFWGYVKPLDYRGKTT